MNQKQQYLDYIIDLNFQGVNRLSVLSFPDNLIETGSKMFYAMSENKILQCYDNGQSFYAQPTKNNKRTYNKT